MTAAIVAPSDAQLGYIADLCRKQGLAPPQAIYSAQEASAIIDAIRAGRYDAGQFVPDADLPDVLRPLCYGDSPEEAWANLCAQLRFGVDRWRDDLAEHAAAFAEARDAGVAD